jgi:hypothetical protein
VRRVQELPAVNAYKFLRVGRVGPFTGFVWEPGAWVEAPGALPCDLGVHACRVDDLPFWTNDELWEVELDGALVEAGHKLVAPRGRLARRIDAWTPSAARKLADEAAARARAHADARQGDDTARAYAEDAERRAGQGKAYATTYIAAVAAEHAGGPAVRDAERDAQAEWFRRLLGG